MNAQEDIARIRWREFTLIYMAYMSFLMVCDPECGESLCRSSLRVHDCRLERIMLSGYLQC